MNINSTIKQLSIIVEGLDEEIELQIEIQHAVELLNEGLTMEAEEILNNVGKRINYLIENL